MPLPFDSARHYPLWNLLCVVVGAVALAAGFGLDVPALRVAGALVLTFWFALRAMPALAALALAMEPTAEERRIHARARNALLRKLEAEARIAERDANRRP